MSIDQMIAALKQEGYKVVKDEPNPKIRKTVLVGDGDRQFIMYKFDDGTGYVVLGDATMFLSANELKTIRALVGTI